MNTTPSVYFRLLFLLFITHFLSTTRSLRICDFPTISSSLLDSDTIHRLQVYIRLRQYLVPLLLLRDLNRLIF